jgi:hypothetical protein
MTKNGENTEKKAWYKVWWKTLIGILSFFGIVGGIFAGVIKVNNEWQGYQDVKHRLELLEKGDQGRDSLVAIHDAYIKRKKKSFAVGFRVVTVYDEDLGKWVRKRKYRGWDGITYEVHRDDHYSNIYGYDLYFYIDEDGEKIYCD